MGCFILLLLWLRVFFFVMVSVCCRWLLRLVMLSVWVVWVSRWFWCWGCGWVRMCVVLCWVICCVVVV